MATPLFRHTYHPALKTNLIDPDSHIRRIIRFIDFGNGIIRINNRSDMIIGSAGQITGNRENRIIGRIHGISTDRHIPRPNMAVPGRDQVIRRNIVLHRSGDTPGSQIFISHFQPDLLAFVDSITGFSAIVKG